MSSFEVKKGYKVYVKAYQKQLVPKFTKLFLSIEEATTYQDFLSSEAIWNTPVSVHVDTVFYVEDNNQYYILDGELVVVG